MRFIIPLVLLASIVSCGKKCPKLPEPIVIDTSLDGYILLNENGDRSFLIQAIDSTGYKIIEGSYDSLEQQFIYKK